MWRAACWAGVVDRRYPWWGREVEETHRSSALAKLASPAISASSAVRLSPVLVAVPIDEDSANRVAIVSCTICAAGSVLVTACQSLAWPRIPPVAPTEVFRVEGRAQRVVVDDVHVRARSRDTARTATGTRPRRGGSRDNRSRRSTDGRAWNSAAYAVIGDDRLRRLVRDSRFDHDDERTDGDRPARRRGSRPEGDRPATGRPTARATRARGTRPRSRCGSTRAVRSHRRARRTTPTPRSSRSGSPTIVITPRNGRASSSSPCSLRPPFAFVVSRDHPWARRRTAHEHRSRSCRAARRRRRRPRNIDASELYGPFMRSSDSGPRRDPMVRDRREHLDEAQPVRIDFLRLPLGDLIVLAVLARDRGSTATGSGPSTAPMSRMVTAPARRGCQLRREAAEAPRRWMRISVEKGRYSTKLHEPTSAARTHPADDRQPAAEGRRVDARQRVAAAADAYREHDADRDHRIRGVDEKWDVLRYEVVRGERVEHCRRGRALTRWPARASARRRRR